MARQFQNSMGGLVVAWAAFAPATAVVAAAQWLAVALTTASQQWTLTLDPDGPAGLAFTRSSGVALRVYLQSTSGAGSRAPQWSISAAGSGSALVESVDFAGALANATGQILVEVVVFQNV